MEEVQGITFSLPLDLRDWNDSPFMGLYYYSSIFSALIHGCLMCLKRFWILEWLSIHGSYYSSIFLVLIHGCLLCLLE